MEPELLERIRAAYATSGIAAGMGAILPLMDPEVEVLPSGGFAGTSSALRGHEGLRGFFMQLYEAFEDFHYEVERLVEYGEDVVVVEFMARGRGRGSGLDVAQRANHVLQVRHGLIVRVEALIDRAAAHAAAKRLSSG